MTNVMDYTLNDMNFAPQYIAPIAALAFQLVAHNRMGKDNAQFEEDMLMYLRQPSHKFNFKATLTREGLWGLDANVTFDYADFDKGDLSAYVEGVNESDVVALNEENVAALVYGLHKDESVLRAIQKMDPHVENAGAFSMAVTTLKMAHRTAAPPFLMRTASVINPKWDGRDFTDARAEHENSLASDMTVIDKQQAIATQMSDSFYNNLRNFHGARQFISMSGYDEEKEKNTYGILAVRANAIDLVAVTDYITNAVWMLHTLEHAYILPEMQKNAENIGNLVAQSNDMLHYSAWQKQQSVTLYNSLRGP